MNRKIDLENLPPVDMEWSQRLLEIPSEPRPGWDYFWDCEKGKWIQVSDNMDMSWWNARYFGFRPLPNDVWPENMRMTGKEWKESYVPNYPMPEYFVCI